MAFLLGQGLAKGETSRSVNSLILDGSYQARRKEPSTSELRARHGPAPIALKAVSPVMLALARKAESRQRARLLVLASVSDGLFRLLQLQMT